MSEQPKDSHELGVCPACGGTFALMVPRKGDGSMVVLRNHGPKVRGLKREDVRSKCPGSRHEPARIVA